MLAGTGSPERSVNAHARELGRGLVALLGAVGLVGVFHAAPAHAVPAPAMPQAKAPTCFGETATIVDRRDGATVRGTQGRDVIVAPAAAVVHARGGDDVICGNVEFLYAEAGDDRVEMRNHPDGKFTSPLVLGGKGDDEIHRQDTLPRLNTPTRASWGGPGNDRLFGGLSPTSSRADRGTTCWSRASETPGIRTTPPCPAVTGPTS